MGAIRVTIIRCYPSEPWSGLLDPKCGTYSFQYANFVFFFFGGHCFILFKSKFRPQLGRGHLNQRPPFMSCVLGQLSYSLGSLFWKTKLQSPSWSVDWWLCKVALCHYPLSIVNAIREIFNSFANFCSSLSVSLQVFECH